MHRKKTEPGQGRREKRRLVGGGVSHLLGELRVLVPRLEQLSPLRVELGVKQQQVVSQHGLQLHLFILQLRQLRRGWRVGSLSLTKKVRICVQISVRFPCLAIPFGPTVDISSTRDISSCIPTDRNHQMVPNDGLLARGFFHMYFPSKQLRKRHLVLLKYS